MTSGTGDRSSRRASSASRRNESSATERAKSRIVLIRRTLLILPTVPDSGGGIRRYEDLMSQLDATIRGDRGPVLLLIHGFPLDRRIWTDVTSRIPESIRLVVPDLRGHGRSALPPGPVTIDDYAR